MLFGESGALLRPLSRRLAAFAWCLAGVGLACGLAVAVGSGVRLSPSMQAVQATGLAGTGASALFLVLAIWTQPGRARRPATEQGETDGQARSFLLAAVVMLVAVAGFAAAGWVSPTGPSPQSTAFSQIFLLGAVDCGLTFLLLNKVRTPEER
ncbi:hypothetical protein [Arthrobacter cupressi]